MGAIMQKIRLIEINAENNGIADFLNVSGKIVKAPCVEVSLTDDFTALTAPAYWKGRELAVSGEMVDVVNAVDFMPLGSVKHELIETAKEQPKETVKPKPEKITTGGYDKGNGKIFGSSALKILSEPGTGYANYMHWLKQDDDDAAHFRIGNALDGLLCQNTNKPFARRESERSQAGKEANLAMKAKGYILLTEPEEIVVYDMRDAIMNHPIAARFFDKNNPDLEFQQVEKWDYVLENGEIVTKRATRDVAIKKNGKVVAFVDLKTTRETTAEGFKRHFRWLGYDVQAGTYSETIELDKDCEHEVFQSANQILEEMGRSLIDYPVIYIAVSTGGNIGKQSSPHHVFIVPLNDAVIASGNAKVEQALRNFSEGKEKESRGEYAGFCEVSSMSGFDDYQDNSDIDFDDLIESEDVINSRINNFGV
jgi:hypothetical protein